MGNCGCLRREKQEITNEQLSNQQDEQELNQQQQQEDKEQEFHRSHSVPIRKKIKETVKLEKSKTQEGFKKLNDYIIKQTLGEGTYGKVRFAEKNSQKYAIKILNKSRLKRQREYYTDQNGNVKIKNAYDNIAKEIAIMKKLRHPNLLRLYEVIDSENSNKLYLVMEFALNGQLIEWDSEIQQFYFIQQNYQINEDKLKLIFRDILKGLYQLHSLGIVHRDLKPQNILFDQTFKAKIGDFGVSSLLEQNQLQGTFGTYPFMAPECFNDSELNWKAIDIWAIGITFYAFAFLTVPYFGDREEIIEQHENKEIEYPTKNLGLINLIQKCLIKNIDQRVTIEELINDNWLNSDLLPLIDEIKIQNKAIEVNEAEIQEAFSLATLALIKNWAQKFKH